LKFVLVGDAVGEQDRIYSDRIEHVELAPRKIADERTAQTLRVSPRPPCPLLPIPEGKRNFVDHEVCAPAIGKGQHRDSERRIALVVGCDVDVQTARI